MNARRSVTAALLLISNGASAANDLAYDPQRPLYTSDQRAYSAAEVPLALNTLSGVDKTTILFIHGRGDEPSKSLRPKKSMFGLGAAVPMLERQYGATVLMFNKAASQNDRARPLSHMAEAAASLRDVIQQMRAYYTANPSTRRAVLLAHSMGTIVVQRYVERYGWNEGERLFSNVLFTGADADNVDHAN